MKEAFECLQRATACETLARHARDVSSTLILQDIAVQWRQLAHDTDRHKRMTAASPGDGPDESARSRPL